MSHQATRRDELPTITANPAAQRRKSPIVIAVQFVFIFAVVVAVAIGLWKATAEQSAAGPAPERIAGYALSDVVSGDAAIAQLRELHGKDVGLSSGWIGYYQNKAVAWVGVALNESEAEALLEAMTGRIAAGNGPFNNLQQLTVNGVRVLTVTGMGQRHYFYQQGKLVIWLAAPAGGEERFLKGALEAIR